MTTQFIKFTPLVTEKSSNAMAIDKYSFIVDKSINKIEFAKHIENNFNVKVLSVNTLPIKSKKRRRGRITGRTVERKKIIVSIDKNSNAEKIQALF